MPRPSHPRSSVEMLEEKMNRAIDRTNRAKIQVKRALNGSSAIYSLENMKIFAEINNTVRVIVNLFWSIKIS